MALKINQKHHPSSGASLDRILPRVTGKSRKKFVMLALFIPGFGLHNFYAGYKTKGFIQLLCTFPGIFLLIPFVVGIIWSFYDVLCVKQDASGIPFHD